MNIDIKKFQKIPFKKRSHCVICGKKSSSPVVQLPDFPITETYTTKRITEKVGFVDQNLLFCKNCGHGQNANVIDVELQYGKSFSYYFRTSQSQTAHESTNFFINFLSKIAGKRYFKTIVELGCNDLHLLKMIKSKAEKLIGIDPILKGKEKEFSDEKVMAIGDFFENVTLKDDIELVICKDTLEHVPDPVVFVKKIVDRTGPNALFLFQFPILETLLAGCRFDQVFHQHLNYFSLRSILHMLDQLGCELISYVINQDHWGAILIAFQKKRNRPVAVDVRLIAPSEIKKRYGVFKDNMSVIQRRLSFLKDELLFGYGAALMLPVLSYHLNNDFSDFKCIIDDDKRKDGLYYVNLPVPVRSREHILDEEIKNSIVLLTAINSSGNVRKILPKLIEISPKQIILPLTSI